MADYVKNERNAGDDFREADYDNLATQYAIAKQEYLAGNWTSRVFASKSGKATFTAATTLVVTHGLGATPTKVLVTGSDTNSSALWITSIGGTTFTINRGNSTGTPDVYWYVEA